MRKEIFRKFEKYPGTALITIIICMNMHAQQNFSSYVDKIFLNVYSNSPEPSMRKFLGDFAPALLQPKENPGKWTAYPTANIATPIIVTHSYIFNKHPFFDVPIKQGEFKVFTAVFNDTVYQGAASIKDIQVIMKFEKSDDAQKLFEKLRKDLKHLGQERNYYEDNSRGVFEIYNEIVTYNFPSYVRIQLFKDRGTDNLYQVSIN